MIGLLAAAVLAAAATHDIAATAALKYSPEGLRVAPGDTVRWEANVTHPLVIDGEPGGPYTGGTYERTLNTPGKLLFHCNNHGFAGGGGMSGVVTVGDQNEPPTLAVQRVTAAPAAGQPVTFRATASDPERLALTIDWDMDGDGTFERLDAGTQVSAPYDPGARTVNARVTDDLGLVAQASHTFTVPAPASGPGTPPPTGGGGPAPPDALAPGVAVEAPGALALRKLRRRGVRVTLTPTEDGRLVAELRKAGRRLGRATADAHAGVETELRVRAKKARAGRLTLRIVAIDAAGNRTVLTRTLKAKRGG